MSVPVLSWPSDAGRGPVARRPPGGGPHGRGAQLPPSAVRAPARLLRTRPREDSPSAAAGARVRFQQQPGRPDPQSQTLSRSYGSKLPTSLTYIVLGTRGCSPWRPAADMGTARCKNHDCSPRFSRAGESASDTAGSAVLYRNKAPISGRTDSRGSVLNKEEKTLPEAPASVSRFVCVAALAPEGAISASGFGNFNPIPFRSKAGGNFVKSRRSLRNCPVS